MPDAVIVSACRTAIGTAARVPWPRPRRRCSPDAVVDESMQRTGIAPKDIDDLILSESMYGGGVIARYVALEAGLDNVPGLAQNRHCAAGLAAVQTAAASIMAGMDSAVIAGGVHSLSTSPRSTKRIVGHDRLGRLDVPLAPGLARGPGLRHVDHGRLEHGQDRRHQPGGDGRLGLGSHERAIAAIDEGRFAKEIVPIKVTTSDGSAVVFEVDEHPRRGSSMEKLATPEGPAPRDRGLLDHRRQRLGRQRRGGGRGAHLGRLRRRPRPDPAGHRALVGLHRRHPLRDTAWRRPWPSPRRWPVPG